MISILQNKVTCMKISHKLFGRKVQHNHSMDHILQTSCLFFYWAFSNMFSIRLDVVSSIGWILMTYCQILPTVLGTVNIKTAICLFPCHSFVTALIPCPRKGKDLIISHDSTQCRYHWFCKINVTINISTLWGCIKIAANNVNNTTRNLCKMVHLVIVQVWW